MADDPFGAFDFSDSEPASGAEAEVKVPRDFQSEEDYLKQQAQWAPTVHKGEVSPYPFTSGIPCFRQWSSADVQCFQIYKELQLPIHNPSKQEFQKILHAVEQLYYQGRYAEAKAFIENAQKGELGPDYAKIVAGYKEKVERRLRS